MTNEDFWRFVEKTAFIPKESPRYLYFREAAATKPDHPVAGVS